MSSPVLEVEKQDGIATLTLNRPEAMNALSRELRGALSASFRDLQADDSIRVAIVTGAGRAFCAGLDLKELGAGETGGPTALQERDSIAAAAAFEGPIIGAVNGYAITGGFELALACDVLIASTEARFADTHIRVGVLPGWGLSQKLPRLIGVSRAKELSLTGNPIGAEQALAWGLVNRVVAPEELLPTCRALAADMLSCDPKTLRDYKKLIDEGYGMTFSDAMNHESEVANRSAADVTADQIAARREGVMERGRKRSRA
jgi:enoyl-CoA hydratase